MQITIRSTIAYEIEVLDDEGELIETVTETSEEATRQFCMEHLIQYARKNNVLKNPPMFSFCVEDEHAIDAIRRIAGWFTSELKAKAKEYYNART